LTIKFAIKKKGITEIVDISNPAYPNVNREYEQIYKDNNNVFNQYNGIFSNLYDSVHRNGNLIVPFRSDKATHLKRMNNANINNKLYINSQNYNKSVRDLNKSLPRSIESDSYMKQNVFHSKYH